MTKSRKPVPDLMKGIAVVTMVQVHLMELFARPDIYDSVSGKVSLFIGGPFAAPVFMAVMGYFIAGSKRRKGDKVKRGVLLILLGIVLNLGLNFHLLIKIYNGTFDLNPLEYIFGVDILFLAGISIIIIALLENLFRKRLAPFLIIMIAVVVVSPHLPDLPGKYKYLQAFIYGHYSWSYFPVFPWLAYPLLGYSFRVFESAYSDYLNRIRSKIPMVIAFTVLVIAILFKPSVLIITDLPLYYHHGLLLFVWMMAFLVLWTWISVILESFASESRLVKYFRWLGKNVTAVYVVQWLIIGNIATAIFKTQSLLALVLWFVAILAASTGVSYLYVRLRG